MSTRKRYDFAVIGAGIAGASVAAELAQSGDVVLLEMEPRPGYHTTGRSAAVFSPSYGPKPIRALTRASAPFFQNSPDGFTDYDLLTPRAALFVARDDQLDLLEAAYLEMREDASLERLGAVRTQACAPLLRDGYAAGALLDRQTWDIDVNALHLGYLRLFKARGGLLITGAEVKSLTRTSGLWSVETTAGDIAAPVVVNAAGAWADIVGQMAGVEKIGLVPKRRTALLVDAPRGTDISEMPLVVDIAETFYLKPDAGQLLISPANEDPETPSDVQPDEMDVALCIDRIERAFNLQIRRIATSWAGLRSFVIDKAPVAGYSDRAEGFFWLAGQGGYGIQSAPALSRLATALIRNEVVPADIASQGFEVASVFPGRLNAHP